jgi:AAA15 family ATPase/GTPase
MEITKFGLQNFRIFKEHFDFELAPIMVLTGPNNSGKSSLSKALLLLKENEDVINNPF